MLTRVSAIPLALLFSVATAQDAVLEFSELLGECNPIFAATGDLLTVYKSPDLRSKSKQIPYSAGWEVPYQNGYTKVLAKGRAVATAKADQERCISRDGKTAAIAPGQEVEYLFYEGEGYGRIRIDDFQCSVQVHPSLGFFETPLLPDVQTWIQVRYADGSSPGWAPLKSDEIEGAGLRC